MAKKIAWNAGIQIAGKIVSVAVAIGAIAILTRYLGAEQFGWYTTTMAFLQFFGIMADFGLVLVTSQMLAEHEDDQTRIINNIFTFRFVLALCIIGIAPLLIYAFPYPAPIKHAVALTSLMFFSIALQQIFTGLFQKHLAMHFATIAEIAGRLLLIAGIALTAYFDLGFMMSMLAMVIANGLQLLLLYIFGLRFTRVSFSYDRAIWKEIISKSYPIAISIAFNMVYLRADVLILSFTHSQIDVGMYGAAYKILDVITQLPILFMGLMIPLMTQAYHLKNNQLLNTLIEKSLHVFIIVAVPMIVGGMILAEPIMTLIAGTEFALAGPIARILFLALTGAFLGALFGHIIVAINKQKSVIWIYAMVALFGLSAYFLFIPRFGGIGAAWVTVATELAAGTLLTLFVYRHLQLKLSWFSIISKTCIATFIMSIPLIAFTHISVIFLTIIAIIFYAVSSLVLKTVPLDELKRLFF